ncbi:MAG: sigma-54-dependent Fis family transcriptional regulator [Rhodocyclaceae bacterium]|nr:sigma-54-dependent Fis family transcriptional regulator [Rhodocyclaceae bacterium]
MTERDISARQRDALAREAREAFFGARRGATDGEAVLAGPILASWRRSHAAGVVWNRSAGGAPGVPEALPVADMRDRNGHLLGHARGAMGDLIEHIADSGCIVILADASATLLEIQGDADFAHVAAAAGLCLGTVWHEDLQGTNAIGLALHDGGPAEIVGSEHFQERLAFLTCAAAPIRDPRARILGTLAIAGHVLSHQAHTVSLVRMGARLIERRLFEAASADAWLVGLSQRPEELATLQEGLLAFSPEGRLEAADATAARQLSIPHGGQPQLEFGMLFDEPFDRLAGHLPGRPSDPLDLIRHDASRWLARVVPPRGQRHEPLPDRPSHARRGRRPPDHAIPPPRLVEFTDSDPRMRAAAERAARVAGKDIPLLILGESGVGKERFARACHQGGPRCDQPFVAVNCAAIPETLIESELFGYAPGAFTGARREGHRGRIVQASGGTLFLDEIGDMPLALQTRLLRVLQERHVEPLGAARTVPVDLAIICATHGDLQAAVRAGRFRADLYFRIAGLIVTLPSLRERTDLPRLIHQIVASESGATGAVGLTDAALGMLMRHAWPGNVRELINTIRVAIALLDETETAIAPHHLQESIVGVTMAQATHDHPGRGAADSPGAGSAAVSPTPRREPSLKHVEREAIQACLDACRGNVSRAARELGISRNTLYRKLGKLS